MEVKWALDIITFLSVNIRLEFKEIGSSRALVNFIRNGFCQYVLRVVLPSAAGKFVSLLTNKKINWAVDKNIRSLAAEVVFFDTSYGVEWVEYCPKELSSARPLDFIRLRVCVCELR